MKEINTEPPTFSMYEFYRTYCERTIELQELIGNLENQIIEEQPTPTPILTVNEFKFLR